MACHLTDKAAVEQNCIIIISVIIFFQIKPTKTKAQAGKLG